MAGKDPCGHAWATLRNGRQTAFPEPRIGRRFWPGTETGENVAGWPVRPRFYQRSADTSNAKPRPAGVCRPARLDDCTASPRGELRVGAERSPRENTGSRPSPRDRPGAGVAAGPLGPFSDGSARNPSGTGAPGCRFRVANGGTGPDHASRSSDGRPAGYIRGVRKGDFAGTNAGRLGPRPAERKATGAAGNRGRPRCGNPESAPRGR